MSLPFNITNPGFFIGGQLTSAEAALVTQLTALSPSDGDIFVYRTASGGYVLEAKPAGGANPAMADITDTTFTSLADGDVLTYDSATGDWINQAPSGGVSDGDKGDITVSTSGTVWTIDDDVVTFAKMQNIATNRILGRSTSGTGDVEALADGAVRDIIGLDTTDSPQFAGVNVGHATDTTITRVSAGEIAVEGKPIPTVSSGAGAPASTPLKVGDIYIDTTGDNAYIAVGTASSADWEISNGGAGGGDVVGPASATDNAIARFDSTTGKLIQNSGWTISDTNTLLYNQGAGALIQLTATEVSAGTSLNLSGGDEVTLDGGSQGVYVNGDDLKTNGIQERTAASGVTIDGVILKDGGITMGGSTLVGQDDVFFSNQFGVIATFSTAGISPVNRVAFTAPNTGGDVEVGATGTDTNISLNLVPKGTGEVQVSGDRIVTEDATQTLGGKTLTSPTITDGTYTGTQDMTRIDYAQGVGTVSALGTLGATEVVDWSSASHFTGTLDQACTITHSNEAAGQKITMAFTGEFLPTFSDIDQWGGGTAPVAPGAGETLLVTAIRLGTTVYGSYELFS